MNDVRIENGPRERAREATDRTESAEASVGCPDCGGRVVREGERGERTCTECGLVLDDEPIDRGPEWRTFDDRTRRERDRAGAPITERRHDRGLSSTIDWRDRDAYGNQLSAKKRRQFRRLRTWDERFRSRDAQDRNLKQAFGEIDRMASALGIPESCRETSCMIYRQAVERELLPGRSIEGMATASLYAAARRHETPRTLAELATVSRVDKVRIQRAYRYLSDELGLELEPVDPHQYVSQLASTLDVSAEAERLTRELLESATAASLHSGRSPVGIAAAALYVAGRLTNEEITQEAVGDAAHVSCVTIRDRYREILEAYENDAPP